VPLVFKCYEEGRTEMKDVLADAQTAELDAGNAAEEDLDG
jgi:hypothetical protein